MDKAELIIKGDDIMAIVGRYCKAYPVDELRGFPGWKEKSHIAETKLDPSDVNQEILEQYYFLHDNFVVTMGIYQDENVVFDEVTAEWKEYCQASLKFVIPEECLA